MGSNGSASDATRLVIFDAPRGAPLREALAASHPDLTFAFQSAWSPMETSLPVGTVPVWHWGSSAAELARHAPFMLRQFVYPLVAQGGSYCVAFAFGPAEFEPPELCPEDLSHLDFEDIGSLLCSDAVRVSLDLQPQLASRLAMTPIEEQLAAALDKLDLSYKAQAKVGHFRVDFLLGSEGRRITVEADGRAYHNAVDDRRRDEALKDLDIAEVLHFTGSQIYRDAAACALEVQKTLGVERHAIPHPGRQTIPHPVSCVPSTPSDLPSQAFRPGPAVALAGSSCPPCARGRSCSRAGRARSRRPPRWGRARTSPSVSGWRSG